MAQQRKIAVLCGSLRKNSYSGMVAATLAEVAPASLQLVRVEIADLPLYNEDTDTATPPASWVRFRNEIAEADGVIFVTPEYNRSTPACIKNAIDVGSRPYGKSVWGGKPGAVISHSMGGIAGFGANHHLRQSLVFLDVPVLQQPEAYIGNTPSLFDAQSGRMTNDDTRQFMHKIMTAYAAWVERLLGR